MDLYTLLRVSLCLFVLLLLCLVFMAANTIVAVLLFADRKYLNARDYVRALLSRF